MSEPLRILLADDDPAMLRLLEVNFRLEGFDVETVSRGDEALERVSASAPAALVMDVVMPGLDGIAVARAMRAEPELSGVPIVLLSARSPEDDPADASGISGLERMPKPFDPADLVSLVRTLTSGAPV
jgi:DNA-binding response OmpR family regulator